MTPPDAPETTHHPTIVGLGEVLWDVFPDGERFGGAPANFACAVAELAHDHADVCMVRMCDLTGTTDVDRMRQLSRRFDLAAITLTRGPEGAVLLRGDEVIERTHNTLLWAPDYRSVVPRRKITHRIRVTL